MTKGLAIIVDDEGGYAVNEFEGDGDAMRAVLGGYLEPAPTNPFVTLWVDEEGKFAPKLRNYLAEDVWRRWDDYGCLTVGRDWLAGNVIVTGGVGPDGETLDIPDEARWWVLKVAFDAGIEVTP